MFDRYREALASRCAPHNKIETTLDAYFRDVSPQLVEKVRAGDLRLAALAVDERGRMVIILSDDENYIAETESSFEELEQIISSYTLTEGRALYIGNGAIEHHRAGYGDSFGAEESGCPVCEEQNAPTIGMEEEEV